MVGLVGVLVEVLVTQVFGAEPRPRLRLLFTLGCVLAATIGVARVTSALARLHGRRSLTEIGLGLGLIGGADALILLATAGDLVRVWVWGLLMAATGGGLLGLLLVSSGAAGHRDERRRIAGPPPPPPGPGDPLPHPPGEPLRASEIGLLRVALVASATAFAVTLVTAFLR